MKRIFLLIGLALLFSPYAKAQTCNYHATTSTFSADLSAATSGQTICLAPGNYGSFSGAIKTGFVTIASDSSAGGTQANVTFSGFDFSGGTYYNTLQNMTIGGGTIGTSGGAAALHVHLVQIVFTESVCINTPTNVNQDTLVDQSFFGPNWQGGQSCTEGRLGISGDNVNHSVVNGVVISNTLFDGPTSGSNGADGININGGAYGTYIGPGNTFSNIIETYCGSVHCDGIQFYGAINTTVTGNYFVNDSDGIMTPDCNGTPMTVTDNVFSQNSGSATNELVIAGGNGDVIDHNTFSTINGSSPRFGNPNACGLNKNVTLTNNILPSGYDLTEGQTTTGWTITNNLDTPGTYVGGTNPSTYDGYALVAGSPGIGGGTGGTNIGIDLGAGSGSPVAPTISTQPTDETVTAAQTATFSVAASGTAPLSYQWSLNGAPITGATSASYTTPATTTANSGNMYTVTVSNAEGSVNSTSVVLTVTTAPVLCPTCPPIGSTVEVGTASTTVRATAVANGFGAALGTVTSGSIATVIGGPSPATSTYSWMQIQFATCTGAKFIAANCIGWMGSDNLTVATPVASLTISPTTTSVVEGGMVTFTAKETNTTASVTWSSNAPGGVYTAGPAPGTFTVTVTAGTLSASATVTVTAPAPSITITTSGDTITIVPTNVPSGESYTCSVTTDGVTKTCSGTIQ